MTTTAADTEQRVNVTAIGADIARGEALRDQIKALTRELKIHEDTIKDVLGTATVGVDADGKVLVRYPERSRTDLVKERVRERMEPDEYAECEQITTYRTLLYGA